MDRKHEKWEVFTLAWCVLALAMAVLVARLFNGAFPFLTVLWIAVPSIVVVRSRDARRVGIRRVGLGVFIVTAAVYMTVLLAVMAVVEPWSHTYQKLIEVATNGVPTDTTFLWLNEFRRGYGITVMAFYSGLVTLFGEELLFRGWLLQELGRRMRARWAVLLQSALFMVPNLIAASVMPWIQGVLYSVVYSWLTVGVVGGWVAWRTRSIWPSLTAVTLGNLVFVLLYW